MPKVNDDIEIIQAELSFLHSQYEKAFQELNYRKLKNLNNWIAKLELKLKKAYQSTQKKTSDYLKEYKDNKKR